MKLVIVEILEERGPIDPMDVQPAGFERRDQLGLQRESFHVGQSIKKLAPPVFRESCDSSLGGGCCS